VELPYVSVLAMLCANQQALRQQLHRTMKKFQTSFVAASRRRLWSSL
jgi:hypothetical protein